MYDKISSSEGLLSRSSSPSFASEEKLEIPRRRNAHVLPKTTYILIGLLVLSLIANVVVVVVMNAAISKANGLLGDETRNCQSQTKLYSPAQDALEYKVTRFESSIYGGETEYQGPPTEHNN
ncbi:hypothetical protein VE02_10011 [Pseudogymnoascus sp. 03VT05]|nr:hypothetical protein VE02_10011 [Pseudogymnoascus sp. 03VT05]